MKSIFRTLFFLAAFSACTSPSNPTSTPPAAADASLILTHKYWVSKPFHDALFSKNIPDSLGQIACGELLFQNKDTVVMTACQSDAGIGVCKPLSANSMEIKMDGYDKPATASLDEKSGVLRFTMPDGQATGWPTEYVAQDDIDVKNVDGVTIQLTRKRLAGVYSILPEKGKMAATMMMELNANGQPIGLGDFDFFEPWVAGIGAGSADKPVRNLMYLGKKGQNPMENTVVTWQMRGDTLRIWNTKNITNPDDMPEYKSTGLRGTYLKAMK